MQNCHNCTYPTNSKNIVIKFLDPDHDPAGYHQNLAGASHYNLPLQIISSKFVHSFFNNPVNTQIDQVNTQALPTLAEVKIVKRR